MTKEQLLSKKGHSLRMKNLRKFVEENTDIADDAPVVVERVEDSYFEGRGTKIKGWDVLKVEGFHYHSALEWNKQMKEEADKIERGEDPEYTIKNPLEHIFGEEELEKRKEQFYQPHCITTDKENEIVYIYSHY